MPLNKIRISPSFFISQRFKGIESNMPIWKWRVTKSDVFSSAFADHEIFFRPAPFFPNNIPPPSYLTIFPPFLPNNIPSINETRSPAIIHFKTDF